MDSSSLEPIGLCGHEVEGTAGGTRHGTHAEVAYSSVVARLMGDGDSGDHNTSLAAESAPRRKRRGTSQHGELSLVTVPCSEATTRITPSTCTLSATAAPMDQDMVLGQDFFTTLVKMFSPEQHWPLMFAVGSEPMEVVSSLSPAEKHSLLRDLTLGQNQSSRTSVVSKFRKYWAYNATLGLSPLPVSQERLATFIQWLRAGEEVSIASAPQYISAVCAVARWLGSTVDASCPDVVKGLLHVWRIADVDKASKKQALPWPATLLFQLKAQFHEISPADICLKRLRTMVLLWFSFVFFSRADSAFGVYCTEVSISGKTVTFVESRFKRKRVEKLSTRTRTAYCEEREAFLEALQHYLIMRDVAWARQMAPSLLLWHLPGESEPSANILRKAVRDAEGFWPLLVPGGFYSGHSLRRGGATASLSIGIPLERICWWGGVVLCIV